MSDAATPRKAPASLLQRRPRRGDTAVRWVLLAAASLSIATTVAIVASLLVPTVEFFSTAGVGVGEFLLGTEWSPLFADPEFGLLPLAGATLVVTGVAIAVCIPLGIGSGIYLSEYASPRLRSILKPTLELLAGVPTVVYGFFALTFVTPLLQDIWPGGSPPDVFNGLAAGLVMGVMILPTVSSMSEDAMSSVPSSLRQGAFALGASRLQVSLRVVVPAALSGIVASFVLAISRAIGETMIVLIAAGGTPNLSLDPTEAMQTMTAFIAAAGIGDQPTGSVGYLTIFAVGTVLFVATFLLNMASIRMVRRFREVYE